MTDESLLVSAEFADWSRDSMSATSLSTRTRLSGRSTVAAPSRASATTLLPVVARCIAQVGYPHRLSWGGPVPQWAAQGARRCSNPECPTECAMLSGTA